VKITKLKLKQLIQEETQKLLQEDDARQKQVDAIAKKAEREYPHSYEEHMAMQQAQLRRAREQSMAQSLEKTRHKATSDWGKGMTSGQLASKEFKDWKHDTSDLERAGRGFAQMDWPITSDDPVRQPHYYDKEQDAWYPLPHGWHTKGPWTGQQYHPQPEGFARATPKPTTIPGSLFHFDQPTMELPPQPLPSPVGPQMTAGEELAWAGAEAALLLAPWGKIPVSKFFKMPRLKPLAKGVEGGVYPRTPGAPGSAPWRPIKWTEKALAANERFALADISPQYYDDFITQHVLETSKLVKTPLTSHDLSDLLKIYKEKGYDTAVFKNVIESNLKTKGAGGMSRNRLRYDIRNLDAEALKNFDAALWQLRETPTLVPVLDLRTGHVHGWVQASVDISKAAKRLGLEPYELYLAGEKAAIIDFKTGKLIRPGETPLRGYARPLPKKPAAVQKFPHGGPGDYEDFIDYLYTSNTAPSMHDVEFLELVKQSGWDPSVFGYRMTPKGWVGSRKKFVDQMLIDKGVDPATIKRRLHQGIDPEDIARYRKLFGIDPKDVDPIRESISKSKLKEIIKEEYNKLLKEHAAQYVWGVKAPYNRVANKYNLHRMSSEKLSKLKL